MTRAIPMLTNHRGSDRAPCRTCGADIESDSGRVRFKRRGFGFCSHACAAADKTARADGGAALRLLSRVPLNGPDDACSPYAGRKNAAGYGLLDWHGRPVLAHRMMYMIIYCEEIEPHQVVCHSCDNPPCCNPNHLWLGTQADNNRDMWDKGRARPRPPRGEDHVCAKITEADVLAIRASNERRATLARRYGLSVNSITAIRTRRAWTHV